MRWMHKVRLYPTVTQTERLQRMLDITRQLYNALLDQRRYEWAAHRRRVTAKAQCAELTGLRAEDARIASVYRECQDAALHRLDLAFEAFFRRIKNGEKAGYPGSSRPRIGSNWSSGTGAVRSSSIVGRSACGFPASVRSSCAKAVRCLSLGAPSWC